MLEQVFFQKKEEEEGREKEEHRLPAGFDWIRILVGATERDEERKKDIREKI